MSTLKVDGIRSNGDSSGNDAITLADNTTCTANITNNLSNRNLIINGAMQVAQRGTSSTSSGYKTIDRINPYHDNIGVTPTYSQVDVTSGGAYDAGFRKAWQVTKGAGTANAASQVNMGYKIEAQDIANSGWKYTDPNSKITLSFWVKTSVSNHNPQILIMDQDSGTAGTKYYQVDIPTLTANTWTRVTTTIPGHADQVYNNDNGTGFEIQIIPWYGTSFTDASNTMNAWTTFGTKPVNSTWLTTNNSTFQVTGIQLEVSDYATDFEHRSYGQELALCQRYYYKIVSDAAYSELTMGTGHQNGAYGVCTLQNPVPMRTKPSITVPTVTDAYSFYYKGTVTRSNTISLSGNATNTWIELSHTNFSGDDGAAGVMRITNNSAWIEVHSEL